MWTLWVRCPLSWSVLVTHRVCIVPSGCSSPSDPLPPPSFTSSQSDRILKERTRSVRRNKHPPVTTDVTVGDLLSCWSAAAYLSARLATLSWSLGNRRTAFQKIRSGGLGIFSATRAGRSSGAHTVSLRETPQRGQNAALWQGPLTKHWINTHDLLEQLLIVVVDSHLVNRFLSHFQQP